MGYWGCLCMPSNLYTSGSQPCSWRTSTLHILHTPIFGLGVSTNELRSWIMCRVGSRNVVETIALNNQCKSCSCILISKSILILMSVELSKGCPQGQRASKCGCLKVALLLFADDAKTVLMTLLAAKCTVRMTVGTLKSEAMVFNQKMD